MERPLHFALPQYVQHQQLLLAPTSPQQEQNCKVWPCFRTRACNAKTPLDSWKDLLIFSHPENYKHQDQSHVR